LFHAAKIHLAPEQSSKFLLIAKALRTIKNKTISWTARSFLFHEQFHGYGLVKTNTSTSKPGVKLRRPEEKIKM